MHNKTQILTALVVAIVAVTSVFVPAAFAKTTKPGWDVAASNNVQVGPPGQSVRPTIVERLENREDSIVNKLSNNNNIPEPQKTNIINEVKSIFDRLISFFS